MLKAEYTNAIMEIAKREHYDTDLSLSEDFKSGKMTQDDFRGQFDFENGSLAITQSDVEALLSH